MCVFLIGAQAWLFRVARSDSCRRVCTCYLILTGQVACNKQANPDPQKGGTAQEQPTTLFHLLLMQSSTGSFPLILYAVHTCNEDLFPVPTAYSHYLLPWEHLISGVFMCVWSYVVSYLQMYCACCVCAHIFDHWQYWRTCCWGVLGLGIGGLTHWTRQGSFFFFVFHVLWYGCSLIHGSQCIYTWREIMVHYCFFSRLPLNFSSLLYVSINHHSYRKIKHL